MHGLKSCTMLSEIVKTYSFDKLLKFDITCFLCFISFKIQYYLVQTMSHSSASFAFSFNLQFIIDTMHRNVGIILKQDSKTETPTWIEILNLGFMFVFFTLLGWVSGKAPHCHGRWRGSKWEPRVWDVDKNPLLPFLNLNFSSFTGNELMIDAETVRSTTPMTILNVMNH